MAPPPPPASAATETTVVAEPSPPPEAEPAPPPVEEAPAPAPAPLTDAQIVKVLELVDSGEIDQAKVVQKKSKNPRVKKFAQMMIQHHTKSKNKGTQLAKKAKLTPEDSPAATTLSTAAASQLEALKGADATSIDSLYISGQAEQHQTVLSMIDTQLLPGATHDGLKTMLGEVRTMVEGHAKEAQDIQGTLAGGAATGGATAPAPSP